VNCVYVLQVGCNIFLSNGTEISDSEVCLSVAWKLLYFWIFSVFTC